MKPQDDVLILGAGIGGLTLALSLHQAGIACRLYEAAPELKPLGSGIHLLPDAVREMTELGLLPALSAVAVRTGESAFFTEHGQPVFREPAGIDAGYDWPQLSIHRGDLQTVLLDAVRERLGEFAVLCGRRCTAVVQDADGVTASFAAPDGSRLADAGAALAIGCDGIHSVLRKQFYPRESAPRYSGVNMWRGVTRHKPILSGASMVRAGWLSVGKMVIHPIRDSIDAAGNQLMSWTAELESPTPAVRDWTRPGRIEDFLPAFADWRFDWLDVPDLIRGAESILEYPMVEQDPLPRWTHGRLTLLGDAAHPMAPRGANGAGQAILDARHLAGAMKRLGVGNDALEAYDREGVEATGQLAVTNRNSPPDAILRVVHERTQGRRFGNVEDVVPLAVMQGISDKYKRITGVDPAQLRARPSLL